MAITDNSLFQALKAIWQKLPLWGKAIAVTFGVLILLNITKPAPEVKPKKEKVWLIDTQFAEPGTHSPFLKLLGRLESPADSVISSSINASVDKILVNEGDHVEAGQILILLNADEARLTYAQREAEHAEILARIETEKLQHEANQKALKIEKELLAITEKSVARFKKLSKNQLSAERQLDEANQALQRQRLSVNNKELAISDHENRLAQLNALEQKTRALKERALIDFEQSEVLAPFSGRVSRLNVAPGENVGRGTALVSMFDTSSLQIRAQIPNRYLGRIKGALNQPASIEEKNLNSVKMPAFMENLALSLKNTNEECLFITGHQQRPLTVVNDMITTEEPARKEEISLLLPEEEQEEAKAPEKSLKSVALLSNSQLPLELSRISGSVGSGRGGIDGLFDVIGNYNTLELGIALEIIVTLPEEGNTFIVPPNALHGIDRIYRVTNNRLEYITVERLGDIYSATGKTTGVLVRSELVNSGDRIMVTNLPHAINGLKVSETRTSCY